MDTSEPQTKEARCGPTEAPTFDFSFTEASCALTVSLLDALAGKVKLTEDGEPVPFNPPSQLYAIMGRDGILMWATAKKRRCASLPAHDGLHQMLPDSCSG
jgi:hypothetical protein